MSSDFSIGRKGTIFNAENWHFYGAVGDSLKWFYYWKTVIDFNRFRSSIR